MNLPKIKIHVENKIAHIFFDQTNNLYTGRNEYQAIFSIDLNEKGVSVEDNLIKVKNMFPTAVVINHSKAA